VPRRGEAAHVRAHLADEDLGHTRPDAWDGYKLLHGIGVLFEAPVNLSVHVRNQVRQLVDMTHLRAEEEALMEEKPAVEGFPKGCPLRA
jgi:hypothetical protein